MSKKEAIQIFEDRQVRTIWDAEQEKWYISIIDVVAVLTFQHDYQGARNYWKVLKHRLLKEGNETVTNCNRLKLQAEDGKDAHEKTAKYIDDNTPNEELTASSLGRLRVAIKKNLAAEMKEIDKLVKKIIN